MPFFPLSVIGERNTPESPSSTSVVLVSGCLCLPVTKEDLPVHILSRRLSLFLGVVLTLVQVLHNTFNDLATVFEVRIFEIIESPRVADLSTRISVNVESTFGPNIGSLTPATVLQILVRIRLRVGPDHTLRMPRESDVSSIAKYFVKNDNTYCHRLSLISKLLNLFQILTIIDWNPGILHKLSYRVL